MTTKAQILKDIRAKCLDCSVYQEAEVRLCPVQACALWPYRMGRDPNPSRKGNVDSLRSGAENSSGERPIRPSGCGPGPASNRISRESLPKINP